MLELLHTYYIDNRNFHKLKTREIEVISEECELKHKSSLAYWLLRLMRILYHE